VIVATPDPEFTPPDLAALLRSTSHVTPVIAFGSELRDSVIRAAAAMAAMDIVTEPLDREHLLSTLDAVLSQTLHEPPVMAERTPAREISARLLVVTADYELFARMRERLLAWDYSIDRAFGPAGAVARARESSYDGVLFDTQRSDLSCTEFIVRYRGCPGMGLVPVVCLVPSANDVAEALPARSSVCLRSDAPLVVVSALNQLRSLYHLGRTFTRYRAPIRADLTFGGRHVPAEVINVARGGVLVQTSLLPSVGTQVLINIFDAPGTEPVELSGSIVRVELSTNESRAHLGISFVPTTSRNEIRLIDLITRLDQNPAGRATRDAGEP
jgi:DNA-binding response OmpR family regulator